MPAKKIVPTRKNNAVLQRMLKDLAAKQNPKGGAAQPGTALPTAGSFRETSCSGAKGCGAKLGT